jgi:hypothetical protein
MKTARLFFPLPCRAKSRRDNILLTVCDSLRAILLPALMLFFCASMHAQVTIGGIEKPKSGAILDLNSTAKGGLLLSNVNITDLEFIPGVPNVFPGISADSLDVNWGLRGALVYNTNATTGPGIYVWTGKYWMPATETETEQILFTVHTEDGTYEIPTRGYVGGTYDHAYDWEISVDGEPATPYSGTGGYGEGITLSGLPPGDHQIRITPFSKPEPGWGNAYGHYSDMMNVDRDEKLISIDAPLTTLAFAPKTTEANAATNASYMFYYLFANCPNLVAPAVIKDTYKLPATVTDLSYFFQYAYSNATSLAVPQDLTPLSGWFSANNSITNLSYFLAYIHYGNTGLTATVNLTSLAGWFSKNNSITNLNYFLAYIHNGNTGLTAPVNLTPLAGWFSANNSITSISNFLSSIHYNNTSLTLSGQVIFPDWIKIISASNGRKAKDEGFSQTFYLSTAKGGDTGEPKFQDGTVLSSLGTPVTNRSTYYNRTGINPVPTNWK